jgi:hypothetical protein
MDFIFLKFRSNFFTKGRQKQSHNLTVQAVALFAWQPFVPGIAWRGAALQLPGKESSGVA